MKYIFLPYISCSRPKNVVGHFLDLNNISDKKVIRNKKKIKVMQSKAAILIFKHV